MPRPLRYLPVLLGTKSTLMTIRPWTRSFITASLRVVDRVSASNEAALARQLQHAVEDVVRRAKRLGYKTLTGLQEEDLAASTAEVNAALPLLVTTNGQLGRGGVRRAGIGSSV